MLHRLAVSASFSFLGAWLQAQPSRTIRFPAGPVTAVVQFRDPTVARLESELRTLIPGTLSRYHELFGGPPRGSNGRPLDTITVDITAAPVGEGTADAGIVRVAVSENPAFGFYDWRLVLLHEVFHLWSGESFRYASGAEQWF